MPHALQPLNNSNLHLIVHSFAFPAPLPRAPLTNKRLPSSHKPSEGNMKTCPTGAWDTPKQLVFLK